MGMSEQAEHFVKVSKQVLWTDKHDQILLSFLQVEKGSPNDLLTTNQKFKDLFEPPQPADAGDNEKEKQLEAHETALSDITVA